MSKRQPLDVEELERGAQQAVLAGLVAGDDVVDLLARVEPFHRPGRFTPDVAVLDLAGTALALACPPGSPPLAYEGLRERYLPEVPFRGRVQHRNSQYALYAVACRRGGLKPDLLGDAGWWDSPLWIYAVYALLLYTRAAAERLECTPEDVARKVAEHHALTLDQALER